MIRSNPDRGFSFLVDWGATVVEGSLARTQSLPSSLIGVHTVIDCSTARPEESIYDIDWIGKKTFIQCCEKMNVQRYIFVSIKDCDKYTNVPLMNIKYLTEKFLAKSGMRHTIIRVNGYMQPLITQYALAILDDQKVWCDDGNAPGIAYIDSQDCARMIAAAVSKERTVGKILTLSGPKVWATSDVINLCEKLSGRKAEVNKVSSILLRITQSTASLFEWSIDIAERLQFVEVSQSESQKGDGTMEQDVYQLLGVDPTITRKLEEYFQEYYRRIFKKLTKGAYEPEDGELEREKEESERKLRDALKQETDDLLAPGESPERDVTITEQREMADRLQRLIEDQKLAESESDKEAWFGWVPLAEKINGRSAMFGFSLGLFTEWATEVNVARQIVELRDIFSSPS
jgi:uncharacterized protein YbjT (DUF2867 family)